VARVKGSVLIHCEECGEDFCVDRLSIPAVMIWYVHTCPDGRQWKITESDVVLEALLRKTRNHLTNLLATKKSRRARKSYTRSFVQKGPGDRKEIPVPENPPIHDAS